MSLHSAAIAAEFLAAITAVLLAWRRPEHRPAAVALMVYAAADVILVPINAALPTSPTTTYKSIRERLLFHIDVALWLLWEVTLPALALWICTERKRLALVAMGVLWAFGSLTLAVFYPAPWTYGAGLARVYLAYDLVGLFITLVAFVQWVWLHKAQTSSHVVMLFIMAADVGILLLPFSAWRSGIFTRYDTAQLALLLTFGVVAIYEGILLWRSASRSSE